MSTDEGVAAPASARQRAATSWVLMLALLAAWGAPRGASAKELPAKPERLARVELEARSLLALGRYKEACDKLEQSQEHPPALASQLSLADCWERAGRGARAWALYRRIATHESSDEQARRLAADRAAALEPRLASLRIHVAGTPPEGLSISLDDTPLVARRWSREVRVDVGAHRLLVQAPGRQPWQRVVQVPAGGVETRVDVPELVVVSGEVATRAAPQVRVAPATSTDAADILDEPAAPSYTAAYVAGGIGLAGLTLAGVSRWIASSQLQSARKLCAGSAEGCPPREKDDREALKRYAKSARDASHVAFGVGALGLVAGSVLMLVAKSRRAQQRDQQTKELKIAPKLGRDTLGVSVSGSF